jgi:SMI1 / KNR4 family (SUKH-1)
MGERSELHARFARRFHFGVPPKPCALSALEEAETALDTLLPESYRQFLLAHGPLFVPHLWDAVVAQELDVHPLREFLNPAQVDADTRAYWSAGMPRDFVGVAGDFMGNLFGFPRVDRDGPRPDDLPVRLFDHDSLRVVPVAESFDGWLRWFVEHVRLDEPGQD